MNQSNDNNVNEIESNSLTSAELNVSAIDSIDDNLIDGFYSEDSLLPIMMATLDYINERNKDGLTLPYFTDISLEMWQQKPKALDIYITDKTEGRELNLEARGKDYATNILSYPSEMPANIIELMPTLPLGELIICHEVMVREAVEQDKTLVQHISHLLVHGVLHLLGFDHELGQAEQDEMERFEIEILAGLNLPNPYVSNT
ncbi:rRNA maturation RNase YbeY [Psychrobacter sp. S1-30-MNA-CIBAN-0213]|uniref:rRNA maturation RNase YbeY n=1 Tax=unclassified Psychrobacter TaxID=196806 RepID=UPI003318194C